METAVKSRLSDLWTRLDAMRPSGDSLVSRTAIPELTDRVKCALDSAGHRHLLVTLMTGEDGVHDAKSRGLSVTTKELAVDQHASGIYIDLHCLEATGYPVLDIICNELANELNESGRQPNEIIRRLLTKWRRFWGQLTGNLLSYEEQLGLFAELWFLSKWLLPRLGAPGLCLWRGPQGSRHDFEWPDKSVEVKATSQARGRILRVNGLDQLDSPMKGPLYLFCMRVRDEMGSVHHIPALVEACRDQISSDVDALMQFENLLIQTGYTLPDEEEYAKRRFRIAEEAMFEVRDDFPRLSRECFTDLISPAIESLEYVINLNGHDHLIVARKPEEWVF